MLPEKPKLRPVEVIPMEVRKGEKAIVLKDPFGIVEHMLALPVPVFALAAMFDGKKTITEVQAEWARRTGQLVFREQIEQILGALDENLYLEGERFETARAENIEKFRRLKARPA